MLREKESEYYTDLRETNKGHKYILKILLKEASSTPAYLRTILHYIPIKLESSALVGDTSMYPSHEPPPWSPDTMRHIICFFFILGYCK